MLNGLDDRRSLTAAHSLVTQALRNVPDDYEEVKQAVQDAQGTILDVLFVLDQQVEKSGSVTFEDAPAPEDVYEGD